MKKKTLAERAWESAKREFPESDGNDPWVEGCRYGYNWGFLAGYRAARRDARKSGSGKWKILNYKYGINGAA